MLLLTAALPQVIEAGFTVLGICEAIMESSGVWNAAAGLGNTFGVLLPTP